MAVITFKKPLVACNPSTMPEKDILDVICSTHVYSDTKFDAESLFKVARNILTFSTNVVDNVVHVRVCHNFYFQLYLYMHLF